MSESKLVVMTQQPARSSRAAAKWFALGLWRFFQAVEHVQIVIDPRVAQRLHEQLKPYVFAGTVAWIRLPNTPQEVLAFLRDTLRQHSPEDRLHEAPAVDQIRRIVERYAGAERNAGGASGARSAAGSKGSRRRAPS